MQNERRTFTRYKARSNMLYIFAPNTDTPFEIKDIGKGGLSFEYHPNPEEKIELESIGIAEVSEGQYKLTDMPCKAIYDIPILSQDRGFRGSEYRRRGLNYGRLTIEQKRILSMLLDDSELVSSPEVEPGVYD